MKNKHSYSTLLLQFIEPLLDESEDNESLLVKAMIGKLHGIILY